jgi:hypothetical protein
MVEPKIAKAMSALHVVQFGLAAGYSDVIFEGDALLVIQDVNMASPHFNTTGHFVESIQQVQGFFSSSYLFTATGRLMAWHIFWQRRLLLSLLMTVGLRILLLCFVI